MSKHALIVGCNYPGSQYKLNGCINDAHNQKALLIEHFGFPEQNIELLLDTDPSTTKPTGVNIKQRLTAKVAQCKAGDTLVFHFSGHGTQKKGSSDPGEDDGLDEALVPTDFNLITDDDLRDIFEKCHPKVHITCICDCCHSGSMLDHPEQQISGCKAQDAKQLEQMGEEDATRQLWHGKGKPDKKHTKHRGLKPQERRKAFAQMLGVEDLKPAQLQAKLVEHFGQDAPKRAMKCLMQLKAKRAQKGGKLDDDDEDSAVEAATQKLRGLGLNLDSLVGGAGGGGSMQSAAASAVGALGGALGFGGGGGSAPASAAAPPHGAPAAVGHGGAAKRAGAPAGGGGGGSHVSKIERAVLITGCQSTETSADCMPGNDPAKACGAMSNAMQVVVRTLKAGDPNKEVSNEDVVSGIRAMLLKTGMTQNPCLECGEGEVSRSFIS